MKGEIFLTAVLLLNVEFNSSNLELHLNKSLSSPARCTGSHFNLQPSFPNTPHPLGGSLGAGGVCCDQLDLSRD